MRDLALSNALTRHSCRVFCPLISISQKKERLVTGTTYASRVSYTVWCETTNRTRYNSLHLWAIKWQGKDTQDKWVYSRTYSSLSHQYLNIRNRACCQNIPSLFPPPRQSLAFVDDFSNQWTKICLPAPVVWFLSQKRVYCNQIENKDHLSLNMIMVKWSKSKKDPKGVLSTVHQVERKTNTFFRETIAVLSSDSVAISCDRFHEKFGEFGTRYTSDA